MRGLIIRGKLPFADMGVNRSTALENIRTEVGSTDASSSGFYVEENGDAEWSVDQCKFKDVTLDEDVPRLITAAQSGYRGKIRVHFCSYGDESAMQSTDMDDAVSAELLIEVLAETVFPELLMQCIASYGTVSRRAFLEILVEEDCLQIRLGGRGQTFIDRFNSEMLPSVTDALNENGVEIRPEDWVVNVAKKKKK